MSDYHTFIVTRTTQPDPDRLLAQLHALDSTVGIQHESSTSYILKKATAWTGPQIAAAQNVLDTAPANSSTLTAQAVIDHWPPEMIGLIDLLLDEFNILRRLQTPPLADRTRAQVLAGIRGKVGQP